MYIGNCVVTVIVERTVQKLVYTQYAGFDEISQYVDSVGFGQPYLFTGRLKLNNIIAYNGYSIQYTGENDRK